MDSELSEEFEVNVGTHQGSVLSPFPFAMVVNVVAEFASDGALSELLYADDLVLMSETMEELRNKLLNWKEAFESKGLKVNHKALTKMRQIWPSSVGEIMISKTVVSVLQSLGFNIYHNFYENIFILCHN